MVEYRRVSHTGGPHNHHLHPPDFPPLDLRLRCLWTHVHRPGWTNHENPKSKVRAKVVTVSQFNIKDIVHCIIMIYQSTSCRTGVPRYDCRGSRPSWVSDALPYVGLREAALATRLPLGVHRLVLLVDGAGEADAGLVGLGGRGGRCYAHQPRKQTGLLWCHQRGGQGGVRSSRQGSSGWSEFSRSFVTNTQRARAKVKLRAALAWCFLFLINLKLDMQNTIECQY